MAAGVAGTTFFAWSDRWASRGTRMTDWAFGLTRDDTSEKPALEALSKRLPEISTARATLALSDRAPRISVVICSHNGAATLDACLRACCALDYPDFEVLVVDDGSTDQTPEIASHFPDVRYLRQEHGGLSCARNYGAEEATGEFIAYTDDDCEPDVDWLFWIARSFEHPRTGAAGGPNLPPSPDGLQEAIVASAAGAPSHVLSGDLRAEHLPGCNLVLRREALQEVGGFQAQFVTAGDDVDLCWRLLDHGWDLIFSPAAFVWHRRRTSILRYLKQQGGYGQAEALLFEAHPGRFRHGGIHWKGSVYGGGPVSVDSRSVIYFGSMGQAGYQGLASHAIPYRPIHHRFDSPASRALLRLCDHLQPIVRAFSRWRHGGPAPRFAWPPGQAWSQEALATSTSEISFLGSSETGRQQFLHALREAGWSPCGDTESWDLKFNSFYVLTADEQHGQDHILVKARLRHPPALRGKAISALEEAAQRRGLQKR